MAAMPTRRKLTRLHFLWLLESSPSLLAGALPTLGSANNANSVKRKSNTLSKNNISEFELNQLQFPHISHTPKTLKVYHFSKINLNAISVIH